MMESLWLTSLLAANLWGAGALDSIINTEQGRVEQIVEPPPGRYDTPEYPKQAFSPLVDPSSDRLPPLSLEVQTDARRAAADLPTPRELIGKRVVLETRTESGPPILSDIPYLSRLFRNVGWSRDSVEILAPIKPGERANCDDPPDNREIMRVLGNLDRGVAPIYEISRDDFEFTVEKLVDRIDPPRFFPMIGPAQLHHCHWKCTVYFTETVEISYPYPFKTKNRRSEVVYIDKDHVHLFVTEPNEGAAKASEPQGYCPGGQYCPAIQGSVRSVSSPPTEPCSQQSARRVLAPDFLIIEAVRLEGKKNVASEGVLKTIRGEHLIRPDGVIHLGIYGSVHVAGLTVSQVKSVVEDHLKPYFVNPQVSVEVKTHQRPVIQAGSTEESGAPPRSPQMSLTDIVRLSQRGIAEDIIVRQMELTGSAFQLTVDDILSLNEQGVSDNVIRTMQGTSPSRGSR